jgi:hypothetical protein
MGDEVSDAFDAFDRRWAERQGVFERRTIRRELELVVMPGQDARALEVARRRGVPESARPKIRRGRDHPRGPHGAHARRVADLSHVQSLAFMLSDCTCFGEATLTSARGSQRRDPWKIFRRVTPPPRRHDDHAPAHDGATTGSPRTERNLVLMSARRVSGSCFGLRAALGEVALVIAGERTGHLADVGQVARIALRVLEDTARQHFPATRAEVVGAGLPRRPVSISSRVGNS